MSSSRVKCVLCETVLAFDREDTWNLIQHLQDYHRHDSSKQQQQLVIPKSEPIEVEMESLPVLVETKVEEEDHHHHHHDHPNCTVRHVIDQAMESEARVTDQRNTEQQLLSTSSSSSDEEDLSLTTSRDDLQRKLIQEPSDRSKKKKTLYKRVYLPKRSLRSGRIVGYRTTLENWRPGGLRITCPVCGRCRHPVVRSHHEHQTKSSAWASVLLCCWPFCCLPCCFPKPKREYLHCSSCDAFLALYDYERDCIQPNFELFEAG